MSTIDFITGFRSCVDDKRTQKNTIQQQTELYPSAVVTLALLLPTFRNRIKG